MTGRVLGLAALVAIGAVAGAGTGRAAVPSERAPYPGRGTPFASWRSRHWTALTGQVQLVRTWRIAYRAHNGARRLALVALPRWYGPHDDPPIPLVLSPHGRGIEPGANERIWGNLPALGRFAVVSPQGQGTRLELYSWGSPGQIADLARMPRIVRHTLPWLRIAPHRIYAVGGSMGGQETLLLLAEHPQLLAGAIAFDAPTNMAARYAAFPELRHGLRLQRLAVREVGGPPRSRRDAWADRSPISFARQLAEAGVPLQIWWSTRDQVVTDGAAESGRLYRTIKRLNPTAPVTEYVGAWSHTAEMHPTGRMPLALAGLGLLDFGGASTTGVV